MSPNTRQIVYQRRRHTVTALFALGLPTAVATAMAVPGRRFGDSYGPILALATGGVRALRRVRLAAGLARPARRRRPVLMTVFFFGTGLSMVATAFCNSPLMLAAAIRCATGLFAAIYTCSRYGCAGRRRRQAGPGALGLNGVFMAIWAWVWRRW